MRLVVDSSILFAALIKDSDTRKIFSHRNFECYIIPINYGEIAKYKKELMKKAKLNEASFDILLDQLARTCIFVEDKVVFSKWREAKAIMWKIDPKDTPFIAAALALGADVWSDDGHFARQKKVKVWKTADLVKILK
mgnify:CR=1 FL=1